MKTTSFLTAAAFVVVSVIFQLSCADSYPRRSQAEPRDIGVKMNIFIATNAYAGRCILRVTVNRFQGVSANFWGAENQLPKTIVGSVELEVDGVRVPIPECAFHDLSQVDYSTQVGFVNDRSPSFLIRGGDAGFAYTARFEVHGKSLKKRIVTLDEADLREKSRY